MAMKYLGKRKFDWEFEQQLQAAARMHAEHDTLPLNLVKNIPPEVNQTFCWDGIWYRHSDGQWRKKPETTE